MDSDNLASVQQDGWKEIAESAREQMRRRISEMATMNQEDLRTFVESMRAFLWFEVSAATFDNQVVVELKRSEAG